MSETRYFFFAGKGGVGKTTMACATAYHYAQEGYRTLIITTDPASNLADVFETEIGHKITPMKAPNLWAMEIDPDRSTEEYRERILAPMRSVMPAEVMKVLEEQFRSPCTTEIASFDRFVDFISGDGASLDGDRFEVVVFDTAPTGHTLRLLELPVDWSRHIEESAKGGGNTCIGPVASIQESKAKYDEAMRLLADRRSTRFFFVLQPEGTSLWETRRSAQELAHLNIRGLEFIVNSILPEEACADPFFRQRYEMQQKYLRQIDSLFVEPKRMIFLRDWEIKGFSGVKSIAEELFSAVKGRAGPSLRGDDGQNHRSANGLAADPVFHLLRPKGPTKTVFFTGKGGVGKTVVSCATAYVLASQGYKTLLLTTDPAGHIGEVLECRVGDSIQPIADVPNLYAVQIDQETAVEEYKARILEEARGKYADDMLLALKEELESPCTEEMAAFEKFLAYAESEEYEAIVFDTAPTGHTLRLLELPFDYKEQVGLMVSTTARSEGVKTKTQQRFDRMIARLKDPQRTVFAFVMYPESTPVVEAHRAFLDLKSAGMAAQFVVANQVLEHGKCANDYFRSRKRMQDKYLREIRERFHLPVAILPLFETEITGLGMVKRAGEVLYGADVRQSDTADKAEVAV